METTAGLTWVTRLVKSGRVCGCNWVSGGLTGVGLSAQALWPRA